MPHQETWRDVVGYEGLYQVSDSGRIKANAKLKGTNYKMQVSERFVANRDNQKGYSIVSLSKDGAKKNFYVHRLVALAFIPNHDNYKEVNHKDGIKSNNSVSNLEWCSKSQNEQHCYKMGLKGVGKDNVLSRKIAQYSLNGLFVRHHENARFVQKELGYNDSVIRRAARGDIKTAYGYKWEYA